MYRCIMDECKEHLFDLELGPLGFSPTFASSSNLPDLGQVGSSYHTSVSSSLKWKENKVAPPAFQGSAAPNLTRKSMSKDFVSCRLQVKGYLFLLSMAEGQRILIVDKSDFCHLWAWSSHAWNAPLLWEVPVKSRGAHTQAVVRREAVSWHLPRAGW